MEILGSDGAGRPILPLIRATRDALAAYVAIKAPTGRRKWAQAEWDLSADEARAVVEGNPGPQTVDKIWKHPRGGWAVLLPVMGAVIGQPVSDFFRQQMREAADAHTRAAEHERLARAAHERLANRLPELDGPGGESAAPARKAREVAGGMGPEAARRLGGR